MLSPTLLVIGFLACSLFTLYRIFILPFISALRYLPGPSDGTFLLGQREGLYQADSPGLHESWIDQYGPTMRHRGFFNSDSLLTVDLKALTHILTRSEIYHKGGLFRLFRRKAGLGLLVAEDDIHKHHRRIMSPAFGAPQVRSLGGIFINKAYELREIWSKMCANEVDGTTRLDSLNWTGKIALDMIGLAGFGYRFNALSQPAEKNDEMTVATSALFSAYGSAVLVLYYAFPPLRLFKTKRSRLVWDASDGVKRMSKEVLAEMKKAFAAGKTHGKDLFSLLIRANLTPSGEMSDPDLFGQIPTFLVSGHATTSVGITWCLHALSHHPDIQSRLRAELNTLSLPESDTPADCVDEEDVAALNAAPYLDAVIKESMRLYPPVNATSRIAVKDDVIPLSAPYIGSDGVERSHIEIRKGQNMDIPIRLVNRSKALWGDDAHEFNPERHIAPPEATNDVPGVWAHQLTFIGGPHACIGYRFSLLEIKSTIAVLVRAFEFKPAVDPKQVGCATTVATFPVLLNEPEKGGQLPLLVTPVAQD